MHVDYNEEERTLVYEYFRHTFLSLLHNHPHFPLAEIKNILRYSREAVKELHSKDSIHIDIKPDNILVTGLTTSKATRELTRWLWVTSIWR
ncbi:unnamed protein product [Discula destructiva]